MGEPAAVSSRRATAERFGRELSTAMDTHAISARRLALELGVARSAVGAWRAGDALPRYEIAVRLAELLEQPMLRMLMGWARSGRCENCGRGFMNDGTGPRRFCDGDCRRAANKLRAGGSTRERAVVAERRVARYQHAIERYCRGCAPEGLCLFADCPLRRVSPLPIAGAAGSRRTATAALPGRVAASSAPARAEEVRPAIRVARTA